jgi:ribosomal protein S18 acetylase RimI-like enzyme
MMNALSAASPSTWTHFAPAPHNAAGRAGEEEHVIDLILRAAAATVIGHRILSLGPYTHCEGLYLARPWDGADGESWNAQLWESVGMSADDVTVRRITAPTELDALEPLWLALHRHHRSIVTADVLVADDALSWRRRRERYREWLAAGDAIVLVAERSTEPVGYAVAHILDGPDDTFAIGQRYAELFSLSVLPDARGHGLGTRLLDELDRELAALAIDDLVVAVMADNHAALRFYERRGLRPTEVYLWRVGSARTSWSD